jgi:uncharacterized protein
MTRASGNPAAQSIPAQAGIGLRAAHHEALCEASPRLGFIEVHTENVFRSGGQSVRALETLRADYPVSLHGVGLGLGSAAGIDREHLARVREAVLRFEPALVSEHACWSHVDGQHFNDLLPLPWSEEALAVLTANVNTVQDALGRRILVENLSQYVRLADSLLGEGEFLAALVETTGCGLLLDVNNLYVNEVNLGQDARAVMACLPAEAIGEIHLAGHLRKQVNGHTLLIDDHGSRVGEPVWLLYAEALARFGPRPTLIEWDTALPELDVLLGQAAIADRYLEAAHGHSAAAAETLRPRAFG